MNTDNKGFSLIELMIVIAIIGILASMAIPSYQTYLLKAKMGELLSAASVAELAAAEYVQGSGETDCTNMPIVVEALGPNDGGLFAYPASTLVASVEVTSDCSVSVVGASGQWGTFDPPVVTGSASISTEGGISWACDAGGVSFAPSTCQ